jgi:lipoprotein signal peptidase
MTSSEMESSGTGPNPGSAPGPAFYDFASHLRLWPVAVIGLFVDLWTKHWAFHKLDPERGQIIIPHLMSFHRSLNTGALFGLGKGLTAIFIVASLLALGFVLFLFIQSTRDRRSLHVALALVLAGALGNLYDRAFSIADVVHFTVQNRQYSEVGKVVSENDRGVLLGVWPEGTRARLIPHERQPRIQQKGVVRDFIRMEPRITLGQHQFDIWPWVFNIADVLLVVGVGLLMLNFWWERREEKITTPAS